MAIAQPEPVLLALTNWRIEPVGDRCLQIRLGDQVSVAVSQTVHAVTEWLLQQQWPGVRDVVPAFTTVAVHFRPELFPRDKGAAFAQLSARIREVLVDGVPAVVQTGREVEVPACYGGEYGPDLDDVARVCEIDTAEVIRLHCATPLVLYTFFFSPGNPFAGPLHPRLNVPRRATPRTLVPAGSVALANGISSIYQNASPGGWNVIGRTPWNLFHVDRNPPTRLQLGDRLRFVPISPAEFDAMLEPRP
ncbi:5-oxoprolinase subunit PxpB [Cupriavidus pauculus]|uniref:Allophanate hydrolase subunit 1 n=1 Tax=Cupriavidus pauculus TaxID=82633 RepID=A0A2N5C6Y3_9BURK|nr:5-oxoprolinase subunit PxpB [Cupriavidus pauculus]PLP97986.1 allophanate hydrolase subunit 1 [Cupriavidus pauculus]